MKQDQLNAFRSVHFLLSDPGRRWVKDKRIVLDVDPPLGAVGIITPNVVKLPTGGYRMYYTVYGPGQWFPDTHSHIRSALSDDAYSWQQEPGIRLDHHPPHATQKVYCPEVIPLSDGRHRMYFEASTGQAPSKILSAISTDGLNWEPEKGVRFGDEQWSYGSPRCVYLEARTCGSFQSEPRYRLYFHQRNFGPTEPGVLCRIVSAISVDGLLFEMEPGVRIAQEIELESGAVYGPEVVRLADGTFRMYYAGWRREPLEGRIFSATSEDGLRWHKDVGVCLDIGGAWDAVKVSEPCVIDLADGRLRMFYEANDKQGTWRILSATSA